MTTARTFSCCVHVCVPTATIWTIKYLGSQDFWVKLEGYLVGDSLTFADLYLAECASEFAKKTPTIFDGFPEIKAHAEKVRSNPALKKWIETRPETKF
ncbi:hypothetical protein NECAME_17928 [Necator americanus]|uniref:glutathione transferase n=1 Tax=Necator americanus TaxID=51031 RepID=W2TJ93_NECAM|nr:hypothetical protein NECAME_17928 [Necator americanus]ETN81236.1 hypothetical protein NECAME_17928 [Necator americanus]